LEDLLTRLNLQENDHVIFKATFQDALVSIGYHMSPVEFDKLWRRYDPLNGGMVSKKVFIDKITNKSESPDRRSVVSRSTNVSNNWTSSNNTYHIVICLVRMLGRLPYYYLSREADLTNNCVGEQNSSYLLRKTTKL